MSKLKVFFHTDFSCAKTGFGTNARRILTYLYNTNKYDLVHYCCNMRQNDLALTKTPWKSIGCLPADEMHYQQLIGDINSTKARLANYGHFLLEDALKEHKPDVYIGQQDFWAFDGYIKEWWNKFPCVIHTTIDSLPILDIAVDNAAKIKNFWVWSDFARKALHELGHKHVKTIHGAVDPDEFYQLTGQQKDNLRKIFNIESGAYVIGFVFRNQLRKSIPHLLEAFKIFKEKSSVNAKLLLHTCFSDTADKTWNIPKLIKDIGLKNEDILVTHVCHECFRYTVKPFEGEKAPCPFCGSQDGLHTPSVSLGVNSDELNEIYNLMDVYCHPFTSGGQEIPIQEAKLAQLKTLITNYSCGEDLCDEDAQSIILDWEKDWEVNTNFIKARTKVESIVQGLYNAFNIHKQKLEYEGVLARDWVIKNYSINAVGKQFEEFLDAQEKTTYDFSMKPIEKDPTALVFPKSDNKEWLKELYSKVLKMQVTDDDSGLQHWLERIADGLDRQSIEKYFRDTAIKDNENNRERKTVKLRDIIGFKDEKKLLFVIPESIGDIFMATSLLENLSKEYEGYKIIVATDPKYFTILRGNPYVDKCIQYQHGLMDNELIMTGQGKTKEFVDVFIFATDKMQRFPLNYITKK